MKDNCKPQYRSPWSVAHQHPLVIDNNDPRAKNFENLEKTKARIGRDVEITENKSSNNLENLESFDEYWYRKAFFTTGLVALTPYNIVPGVVNDLSVTGNAITGYITGESNNYFSQIKVDKENNYYLIGRTYYQYSMGPIEAGPNLDGVFAYPIVIKISPDGEVLWKKKINLLNKNVHGTAYYYQDYRFSTGLSAIDNENNLIIFCYGYFDYIENNQVKIEQFSRFIKMNKDGDVLWHKGESPSDGISYDNIATYVTYMDIDSNNNIDIFNIFGKSFIYKQGENFQAWFSLSQIFRYDSFGNFLKIEDAFSRNFDYQYGSYFYENNAYGKIDSQNNRHFVYNGITDYATLVGEYSNPSTFPDKCVYVKKNNSGDFVFAKEITISNSTISYFAAINVDSSQNAYIAISLNFNTNNSPYLYGNYEVPSLLLIKINSSGNVVWIKKILYPYNASTYADDDYFEIRKILIDSTNNIYVISMVGNDYGVEKTNLSIIKFNSDGIVQWQRFLGDDSYTTSRFWLWGDSFINSQEIDNFDNLLFTFYNSTSEIIKLPSDGSLTGSYSFGNYSPTNYIESNLIIQDFTNFTVSNVIGKMSTYEHSENDYIDPYDGYIQLNLVNFDTRVDESNEPTFNEEDFIDLDI